MAPINSANQVLAELADLVLAVERPHPVRVAIDGCSAAGKPPWSTGWPPYSVAERTAR